MYRKNLDINPKSKLSETLHKLKENSKEEKMGFITTKSKSSLSTLKAFRLRESDIINFRNILSHINHIENRMVYSDSQIIRGLINYVSDNIESHQKKLIQYIRSSS